TRVSGAKPVDPPVSAPRGARFAEFLACDAAVQPWPFLADLARFEWARLEVFDAPEAEPLRVARLRGIAPAGWRALTFKPLPPLRLLRSAWPVHEIWAATGDRAPCEPLRPMETDLRIGREGFTVYHSTMDATERRALDHWPGSHSPPCARP